MCARALLRPAGLRAAAIILSAGFVLTQTTAGNAQGERLYAGATGSLVPGHGKPLAARAPRKKNCGGLVGRIEGDVTAETENARRSGSDPVAAAKLTSTLAFGFTPMPEVADETHRVRPTYAEDPGADFTEKVTITTPAGTSEVLEVTVDGRVTVGGPVLFGPDVDREPPAPVVPDAKLRLSQRVSALRSSPWRSPGRHDVGITDL